MSEELNPCPICGSKAHLFPLKQNTSKYCINCEGKECDFNEVGTREKVIETWNNFEKLKPCPFCGGTAYLGGEHEDSDMTGYYVECTKCDVIMGGMCWNGGSFSTKEEAIKAWNRRVDNDA